MPDNTTPLAQLFTDECGVTRCAWCHATPAYQHYHDHEWGFPVSDDRRLFEKIGLEGFQAGLSWLTILNKRDAFRKAFANFDREQVAAFSAADVQRLMLDPGIVRHQGKIVSIINNAQRAGELCQEFGSLAAYFWRFEPRADHDANTHANPASATQASPAAARTQAAQTLSKDLRKRGWTFVGPTTAYAFMQAMGLVNDHVLGCSAQPRASAERARFQPPACPGRA
jgi:DNA-3-methyladenine glycosylase I